MAQVLTGPASSLPAVALAALGLMLTVWGFVRQWPGIRRPLSDPRKALALVRCLRTTILGLAAVAVGAAWLGKIPALAGVALVIAGEELLEISVVVGALKAAPGIAPAQRSWR